MKKFISLAIVGLLTFTVVSCNRTNDAVVQQNSQDNDTYSTAYDLNNVSFAKDGTGEFTVVRNFNTPLVQSDVVLIYRQFTDTDGQTRWQSIPRTLFLSQGELDYDFSFNKIGIVIRAGGNFDPSLAPTYINNQTFRVVVVPAATGKNAGSASLDLTDYASVAKYYNIKEANVRSL